MHSQKKLYTEPKLSPINPTSAMMEVDWYVWFRYYDTKTNSYKQFRYKQGINTYKVFRERLAEANALKKALLEELNAGWNPITDQIATTELYNLVDSITYINKIKAATLRKKTKYAYTYITKLFIEWLQETNNSQLLVPNFTADMAQRYMDQLLLKKGYSGRTFNDHLICLRTFFNCFIERTWIDKNPFSSVKPKTATIGRNHAYSDAERHQLATLLKKEDERLYFLTQIMFHCFIRLTELTFLQVKHIDLLNNTIIIPGYGAKNDRQESVVIPKTLEPILRSMELYKYQQEDFVFGRRLQTCSTQFMNSNHITARHKKYTLKLNLSADKGLYSWKHTGVCSYYYSTGKDIWALMRQLRHSDLNTTQIYLKSLGLTQNDAFRNAMVV